MNEFLFGGGIGCALIVVFIVTFEAVDFGWRNVSMATLPSKRVVVASAVLSVAMMSAWLLLYGI